MRGRESNAWSATRSPSLSATQAVSSIADTARSIRGSPATGSDICRPAIDREDDLVVALGAVFLGVELQVPRRLLPVDRAAVHARAEFDQRVEIGAVAAVDLRDQPLQRVALEDLARRVRAPGGCRAGSASAARRWRRACCFHTSPSGPRQRSHTCANRAVPRRSVVDRQRDRAARRRSSATVARPSSSTRAARSPAIATSRAARRARAAARHRRPSPRPPRRRWRCAAASAPTRDIAPRRRRDERVDQRRQTSTARRPGERRHTSASGHQHGDQQRDRRARRRRQHREARRVDQRLHRRRDARPLTAAPRSPR